MKVSFLIPAYNAGTTINRTLASILNQHPSTLDYEIIVADDGSMDNTKEVVKKYLDNPAVKYFFKENEGIATTRNFLAEKAEGEYLIYVDSDDYISETLLQDIQGCVKAECDLIKWNPIIEDEYLKEIDSPKNKIVGIMSGEEAFNKLYGVDPLLESVWNYAIRRDKVLHFPDGAYHEDFATMPLIILGCDKVAILPDSEYYYVQTAYSITRGNDNDLIAKRLKDILTAFDNLLLATKTLPIEKKTKENVAIFGVNSLLSTKRELKRNAEMNEFFTKELKKRHISKYIKVRGVKQLFKKILLAIKY